MSEEDNPPNPSNISAHCEYEDGRVHTLLKFDLFSVCNRLCKFHTKMPDVKRVFMTDALDLTIFEWNAEHGVIFPEQSMVDAETWERMTAYFPPRKSDGG